MAHNCPLCLVDERKKVEGKPVHGEFYCAEHRPRAVEVEKFLAEVLARKVIGKPAFEKLRLDEEVAELITKAGEKTLTMVEFSLLVIFMSGGTSYFLRLLDQYAPLKKKKNGKR